jgi:hypothetical protein
MSVVSFVIVEDDVMERGPARDGNTNKQEKHPSENCSSTDGLEAALTTNN